MNGINISSFNDLFLNNINQPIVDVASASDFNTQLLDSMDQINTLPNNTSFIPSNTSLTAEQKAILAQILAKYNPNNYTLDDMRALISELQAAQIPPGAELSAALEAAGFTTSNQNLESTQNALYLIETIRSQLINKIFSLFESETNSLFSQEEDLLSSVDSIDYFTSDSSEETDDFTDLSINDLL
jgi:hypothetical protein